MTVLVVAFISCRFYSRTVLTKTLGWDDGIMLLAAVSLHAHSRDNKQSAEHLGHIGREQHYGYHFDAAAVPNGLSPLYDIEATPSICH